MSEEGNVPIARRRSSVLPSKNSDQFAAFIQDLTLQPDDIMVSFDVVSLFTSIPTSDACAIAKDRLQADTTFQDRTDLTPDQLQDLLLTCVDNTFVIWQHGQDNLQLFLEHLNKLHSSIQFTMEQERDGYISFLDVEVSRKPDGSLARSVYRKPTHTDRYLHSNSFHHPRIKSSVNRAHVRRAYNDHLISWSQAELLTSIDCWYPRHIREAIEIIKHNTVPQDIGFNISDIWRPILKSKSDGSPIP
ncbi:uncharacterized protein LOC119732358 [Patiria miniata]|uniref:Reverse transcriptase domain-containing protein n=1 Tax=Patiria miniata TaxID=46514 RepID=A0A914AD43_PATMI|nr:uncharacterized protein LOC119732358 [Patiria miniata]